MKTTLNVSDFRDAFRSMGRTGQFSYEGLGLLFDYLEELDPDYELDVIALCCDYSESTADELVDDYSIPVDGMDDDEKREEVLDFVNRHSFVVGETDEGTIVYAQF